jgi:hypothetical protein
MEHTMKVLYTTGSRVMCSYGDLPIKCANCGIQIPAIEIEISVFMINVCTDCAIELKDSLTKMICLDPTNA